MSQIFHLPKDIRQEFFIDTDGKAYASQSAIARLCGVKQPSINELLGNLAIGKIDSESLQAFTGKDYRGIGKNIPDIVVAAIINHYAMYARNTTELAKRVCLCFQAMGIRTWIHEELGWQQDQDESTSKLLTPSKETLDLAIDCLEKAGISSALIHSWRIDQYIKHSSSQQDKAILIEAKKLLSAHSEIPSLPMSPTEIGSLLGGQLGTSPIKAQKINQMLIEYGLQFAIKKKSKSGKERTTYQLTEMGRKYGHIETTTARHSDGTHVAFPRWFSPVIDFLIQKQNQKT